MAEVASDDELTALREAADLPALAHALLRRGDAAIERGAWREAQRDLDEAIEVAALAALPAVAARAKERAAFAYRADGQPRAAAKRA